jgi:hypothetical protein
MTGEIWHVCCHGCTYEELLDGESDARLGRGVHSRAFGHHVSARRVDARGR